MEYIKACKIVLSHLIHVFGADEVSTLTSWETITIQLDAGVSGVRIWNTMFDIIYTRKGQVWLSVAESIVKELVENEGIELPKIYVAELDENVRRVKELVAENDTLKESLTEIRSILTRCKVTGLYNEKYFIEYGEKELAPHMKIALMAINVDNLASINYKYGSNAGDETLKVATQILSGCGTADRLFRLSGCHFVYLVDMSDGQDVVEIAEDMRRRVEVSQAFIEKTTISIGIAFLGDLSLKKDDNIGTALYKAAIVRMNTAKKKGMNSVSSTGAYTYTEDKSKILVVDSDPVIVEILRSSMTKAGLEVLTAMDGLAALHMVTTTDVALVLSEVILPKIDGVMLKSKINEQSGKKDIPFMLMSYKKEEADVTDAFMLGACQYFKKPFILAEVIGVIKNTLKKR